jgi:hypothetical protein
MAEPVLLPAAPRHPRCQYCRDTGLTYASGAACPCPACRPVSIVEALATWSKLSIEFPFLGATGDVSLDRRLADALRALIAAPTLDDRLRWLEGEVFLGGSDFPPPAQPVNRYRAVLIRWWLDLYEDDRP